MKHLLRLWIVVTLIFAVGCSENYDDSELTNRVDNLESRVTKLEELCKQMNTNISSLQTLVNAIQQNDYVTGVTPITKNGEIIGYTISFTKSDSITIYHGQNGKDGNDGTNGINGQDGHTPIIGVKQDTDSIYYWTIDGEWLLDGNGNKVKAVGTDGKDGQNGTDGKDGADGNDGQNGANGDDGITPQLKIENNYWYISYDNGCTWTEIGKATGDDGANGIDGKDGIDGDSMFSGIDYTDDNYVILTLSDGTEIKLPTWYAFEQLQILCNQMNTNISSLQTIITAIQNNDYVQSIEPFMENGKEIGYTITFTKSGAVTIYHGKDGVNGANGANGVDGHTPIIGVKQHTDSIYYWTIDGEWLLDDNGDKVKAVGTDGKDGQNGTNGSNGSNGTNGTNGKDGENGITPELKIEGGYWYVSYDNGASWTQLGKATGEDGKDGQNGTNGADGKDGDSFFKSITEDKYNVYITLVDGTTFTIPKISSYLFNRLQSVNYIPKYSDGKATVINDVLEMDFQISPKDAIKDIAANWQSILSLKAIYTITRAVSFIDMPILSFAVDETNGVITITASAENLSEEFFIGTQEASATLMLSDDNNEISSGYIPIIPYHPYNEIWYTSTDGYIIKPSVSDTFGANIISNNVINGKGIIKFDGAVTTLGDGTFESCTTLSSITIPNSVTTLEGAPFVACNNLTAIYSKFASDDNRCLIKDGVLRSFAPGGLTTYTIPNTVTMIEDYVFVDNNITNITIPNSVEMIGEGAFAGCSNLTSITIPDGVKSIGRYAFEGCSNVTSVTIPNSVMSIGVCAFNDCTGELIVDCNIPSALSPVFSGSMPFGYSKFSKVIIGDNVSTIGAAAFLSCTSITSITLGSHITSIEAAAFRDCNITSITIPESVTSIGYGVFYDCASLVNVFCKATTPPSIDKGAGPNWEAFKNNVQGRKIYVPSQSVDIYKIADGWNEYADNIVPYDFENNVEVPVHTNHQIWYTSSDGNIVTPELDDAFEVNIVSNTYKNEWGIITFDGDINMIGFHAFSGCKSLTSVIIPNSVTEIGSWAFAACSNLTSVTIPDSVTAIRTETFYGCSSLTSIYCKPTTPPTGGNLMFKDHAPGRKIYVPRNSIEAYKSASYWSEYASDIEAYDFE